MIASDKGANRLRILALWALVRVLLVSSTRVYRPDLASVGRDVNVASEIISLIVWVTNSIAAILNGVSATSLAKLPRCNGT